jgi:hypothetical protein
MREAEKRDWLAIILIGAGSSFARGPDREDTIRRVVSICASDWGGLFDLSEKPVSVNVYDVTGFEKVWWDHAGVHTADDPKDDAELPHEVVQRTFPKRKARRA